MANRSFDAGTLAAVIGSHVPYVFFVEMGFSVPLRVCTAAYNMVSGGNTWLGLGTLGALDAVTEQASMEATGVKLTLSGVPPDLIAITLAEQYQGRYCSIWFAPLKADMQLISAPVPIFSGRMDTMDVEVGDTATITLTCESRMVAWDRAKVRRFNHEDQISRYPDDLGLIYVSQMVEKSLVWGR